LSMQVNDRVQVVKARSSQQGMGSRHDHLTHLP
jgi:hypothetical protein